MIFVDYLIVGVPLLVSLVIILTLTCRAHTRARLAIKSTLGNPLVLTAILLSIFTIVCAVELLVMLDQPRPYIVAQSCLVFMLAFVTTWCWRLGVQSNHRSHWILFLARVVPLAVSAYVAGYFLLMDRNTPTLSGPGGWIDHQSCFRFHPTMGPKVHGGPWVNLPMVTVWNFIYDPMDSLYFSLFPRPADEIAGLKRKRWM